MKNTVPVIAARSSASERATLGDGATYAVLALGASGRYADDRINAVVVCRNASGNTTGAEILGTAPHAGTRRIRGMAPGSRKAHGGFWLRCDRNRPAVILTESAVDVLSARSLRIRETREHGAVVASSAGIASSVPTWIEVWKPKRIVCAVHRIASARARRRRVPERAACGHDAGEARANDGHRRWPAPQCSLGPPARARRKPAAHRWNAGCALPGAVGTAPPAKPDCGPARSLRTPAGRATAPVFQCAS